MFLVIVFYCLVLWLGGSEGKLEGMFGFCGICGIFIIKFLGGCKDKGSCW